MQTHFKIQYKTTVNAPVEKVWDALTNPEIVKQYFFGTELVTNWKVGEDIVFQGEWEGQPYKELSICQNRGRSSKKNTSPKNH